MLDGAIAAARLVDNPQGLAWNLFNRSYAAFAAGDIDLALATAKEAFDLAQQLDPGPVPAHAAVALAYARLETGHAERSAELLVEFAGGNELRLIGGGWRARYLELLTRSFLAAGRRDEAEHAAAAAQACAEAVGLPMARAMAALAAAALDLDGGQPSAAAERALSAAAALEEVGNVFDAATSRLLAGRALAEAARARSGRGRARARSGGVRVLRLAPLPTAGRTGAPEARTLDPPAHAPGQGRWIGRRLAHRARAPDRTTRRRPQDQSSDRGRALPQLEDRRNPPAQHLPQARRRIARRSGARRRARRTHVIGRRGNRDHGEHDSRRAERSGWRVPGRRRMSQRPRGDTLAMCSPPRVGPGAPAARSPARSAETIGRRSPT